MNYRHRARKVIDQALREFPATLARVGDRPMAALVEEIAWQLRRAEFEGARAATLRAANNAADAVKVGGATLQPVDVVRIVIEGAYVPRRFK